MGRLEIKRRGRSEGICPEGENLCAGRHTAGIGKTGETPGTKNRNPGIKECVCLPGRDQDRSMDKPALRNARQKPLPAARVARDKILGLPVAKERGNADKPRAMRRGDPPGGGHGHAQSVVSAGSCPHDNEIRPPDPCHSRLESGKQFPSPSSRTGKTPGFAKASVHEDRDAARRTGRFEGKDIHGTTAAWILRPAGTMEN